MSRRLCSLRRQLLNAQRSTTAGNRGRRIRAKAPGVGRPALVKAVAPSGQRPCRGGTRFRQPLQPPWMASSATSLPGMAARAVFWAVEICALMGQQTPLVGGGRGMCRPAHEGCTACGTSSLVRPARPKPGGKTESESREGKRASHRGRSQVSGQAPPDLPPLLPRTTPRPALLSARLRPPQPGLFLPSLSSSPSTGRSPRNVLTCRPGTRPSCHGRAGSGAAGCSEGAAGPGRAPRPR